MSIEFGKPAQRQRHRLEQQHRAQQARGHRSRRVVHAQPLQRAAHRHQLGQVVVRNLALGAAHRRSDGATHFDATVFGRRHRRRSGRGLDVFKRNGAFRPGAANRADVDAPGAGAPARGRAHAQVRNSRRCGLGWQGGRCHGILRRCRGGYGHGRRRRRGWQRCGRSPARREQPCHHGADSDCLTGLRQQLMHRAVGPALDVHGRLGRIDDGPRCRPCAPVGRARPSIRSTRARSPVRYRSPAKHVRYRSSRPR